MAFKKKQYKNNEDKNLEKEISQLEDTIQKFRDNNLPVSDILLNKLSELKAKLKPNKINARKFAVNGIEYDSIREAKFAQALIKAGIPFEHQVEFILQPSFKIEGESIQDIAIIVDFVVDGQFIVDVKGYIMPVFSIKWKMLKYNLKDTYKYFTIEKDSDINGFISFSKFNQWKESL